MRLAYLPLLLLPAVAQAQEACPTAADLEAGISFDLGEGDTEVYKPFAPGVVIALYISSDGDESRTLLGQGAYLLEYGDIIDGKIDVENRTVYSHKLAPADMPKPSPNGRWTSETASLMMGDLETVVLDHRMGPLTTMTLGTCTYDMFEIKVYYDDEGETIDTLSYLPELGVGLLVGISYDDGEGRVDDVYTYLDIKAVEPRADGPARKSQARD